MYSLKETVLNIHIKTRNTLKKVLHWTVFSFFFFFLFTLVTRPLPVLSLHSAKKHTCCQLTYFKHFDGSHSNKKPTHSIPLIKLEILSLSQVWYWVHCHLPSQGFTLHTARHTAFTHTATSSTGWDLTVIHYQIPWSNWIPTVNMLKLSNGFKNMMIVFF